MQPVKNAFERDESKQNLIVYLKKSMLIKMKWR